MLCALLLLAGSLLATPAEATHFRYGTLSYTTDGDGNVTFTLIAAFRRCGYSGSGPDGCPVTGDIVAETIGGTGVSFGDGASTGLLEFEVVSFDVADDFIIAVALEPGTENRGIPHSYSGAGPFEAGVGSCCRIGDLNNRRGGRYLLTTTVFPQVDNDSPTTSLSPIVRVNENNASFTFTIPATDNEGDALTYRVATSSEAGGGSGTPTFTIDAATGQVTLDGTALAGTATFYTEQVIIEERDADGNVVKETPVDFLLRTVDAPVGNLEPEVAIAPSGPLTVAVGTMVSYEVEGTDPDGDEVTLNITSALPAGASLSPALPLAGPSPVSTTFSWTPSAGQEGSYVFNYSVEDEAGLQAQESIILEVVAEQEFATVAFEDQVSEDSLTVVVESVSLPEDGYVAIHRGENGVGPVIGVSGYLEAGLYSALEVVLFDVPGLSVPADTVLPASQALIAMPHQETSGNETYNFLTSGGSEDVPYFDADGNPVIDGAFITLEGGLAVDTTPPVCGAIDIEENAAGDLAAIATSATDPESGIASVTFTTLDNLEGFLNGGMGPYAEGDTETFDAATTETVEIRGERIDFSQGGAILTEVVNAAGLSSQCDPVTEQLSSTPAAFALKGNYPNPVRGQTTIEFHLAEQAAVTLEVYDVLGRKVATLADGEEFGPGSYQVTWDAEGLSSGTYVYRVEAGAFSASRRMVLVR